SIQFLFRALYNKEADVYYPKENILKVSDGKWNAPQGFRLSIPTNMLPTEVLLTCDITTITCDNTNITMDDTEQVTNTANPSLVFNFDQLVGRSGYGSISNAFCVIESASLAVDPILGQTIVEVFVSDINKQFNGTEDLIINY